MKRLKVYRDKNVTSRKENVVKHEIQWIELRSNFTKPIFTCTLKPLVFQLTNTQNNNTEIFS